MAPKSNAEALAEARERAAEKGRCIVCRKRRARPGKKTCKKCSDAAKARVIAAREAKRSAENHSGKA